MVLCTLVGFVVVLGLFVLWLLVIEVWFGVVVGFGSVCLCCGLLVGFSGIWVLVWFWGGIRF